MQKIVACFLLVLVAAAFCDAQRPGRGRGRGRGGQGGGRPNRGGQAGGRPEGGRRGRPGKQMLENANVYEWEVTVGDNLIPQKGFVIKDEIVLLKTMSRELRALEMRGSVVLVNTSTGAMAIRTDIGLRGRRPSPCFMSSLSSTLAEIEADFAIWNTTEINFPINAVVSLNATEAPLDEDSRAALVDAFPGLQKFCRGGGIILASAMTAGQEDTDTRTLKVLGYNTEITLMVPAVPIRGAAGAGDRQGGGQGGRRGGRQGGSLRERLAGALERRQGGGQGGRRGGRRG